MGTKGKRRLGILAGVLVLLYLVLWKGILPAGLERAIPLVEQTAGGYINGQLQMETMEVSPDLTFTARNLRLEDEQGNLVAQVPALSLQVDPLKFLTGSGAVGTVTRITLDGPRLYLVQNDRQEWNVAHLLKESQSSSTDFKGLIAIRDGSVELRLPYGTWQAGVEGTIDPSRNPDFALDLTVTRKDQSIHVAGTLNTDRQGTLTARTELLALQDFSPLAEQFLPVTDLSGALADASVTWTNNASGSQLSGKALLRQVGAVYEWEGKELALGADGDLDGLAGVHGLGAAHQAVGAAHGDAAGDVVTGQLRHLDHQLLAVVVDLDGVEQVRQLSILELDVQHRADDLDHLADVFFGHRLQLLLLNLSVIAARCHLPYRGEALAFRKASSLRQRFPY